MAERPLLFGVPVDLLTMDETIERLAALVEERRFAQHAVINASKVGLMEDVEGLREQVAAADVINADGQSVVWAGRLMGVDFPERVAGVDVAERLLAEAASRGWPVYFLGARADVLERAVASRVAAHPGLVVAGAADGYYADARAAGEAIAGSGARVLLLGMSSPRKEAFVDANRDGLGPLLAVGVGGTFDIWAGETSRAPRWMQRLGLEWFHRFAQEPGRMWRRYLVGNARFVRLAAREWRARRSRA